MILGTLARVERRLASAGNPPTVEGRKEVVTTSVHGVLVDAIALRSATRTHCGAPADQGPDLRFLLLQGGFQALCDQDLDLFLPQERGNPQAQLLSKPQRVLDGEVRHDGEPLGEEVVAARARGFAGGNIGLGLGGQRPQGRMKLGQLRPPPRQLIAPALRGSRERVEVPAQKRHQARPLDPRDGHLPLLEEARENLVEVGVYIEDVLEYVLPIPLDEGLLIGPLRRARGVRHVCQALRADVRGDGDECLVEPLPGQGVVE
mmetsp:Transcript_125402/g.362804  ORF Transcript_125402/g.362804 Transcript_125402/m.362804 type:complete len:261 (+) Transcript_125402:426-1208(+)